MHIRVYVSSVRKNTVLKLCCVDHQVKSNTWIRKRKNPWTHPESCISEGFLPNTVSLDVPGTV